MFCVALIWSGCWASFPDERLNPQTSDGTATADSGATDLVQHNDVTIPSDMGNKDTGNTDIALDQLTLDTIIPVDNGADNGTDNGAPDLVSNNDVFFPPDVPTFPDTFCTDKDLDKVTTCQGDCNDDHDQVFPGQINFYKIPADSSFDYNCDKVEELQITTTHTACIKVGNLCQGTGWKTAIIPACGKPGELVLCENKGPIGCKSSTSTKSQGCR